VVVSPGLDAVGSTRASACSGLRSRYPAAGFTVCSALGCGAGAARGFKPGSEESVSIEEVTPRPGRVGRPAQSSHTRENEDIPTTGDTDFHG